MALPNNFFMWMQSFSGNFSFSLLKPPPKITNGVFLFLDILWMLILSNPNRVIKRFMVSNPRIDPPPIIIKSFLKRYEWIIRSLKFCIIERGINCNFMPLLSASSKNKRLVTSAIMSSPIALYPYHPSNRILYFLFDSSIVNLPFCRQFFPLSDQRVFFIFHPEQFI